MGLRGLFGVALAIACGCGADAMDVEIVKVEHEIAEARRELDEAERQVRIGEDLEKEARRTGFDEVNPSDGKVGIREALQFQIDANRRAYGLRFTVIPELERRLARLKGGP